jgi:hypothetical protein
MFTSDVTSWAAVAAHGWGEFTMPTRTCQRAGRWLAVLTALLACSTFDGQRLHSQELLPLQSLPSADASPPAAALTQSGLCPAPSDKPLSALTVDIYPHDSEGQPVSLADVPPSCWGATGQPGPVVFIEEGPARCSLRCHDMLQLARFCHQPLYFQDVPVERCGKVASWPGFYSAARFTCDLVLWPARMLVQKPCSCIRSPTPHCCSPYGCTEQGCQTCVR